MYALLKDLYEMGRIGVHCHFNDLVARLKDAHSKLPVVSVVKRDQLVKTEDQLCRQKI